MLTDDLAHRGLLPLLTLENGDSCTAEAWPRRRLELLERLQAHCYGRTPPAPRRVEGAVVWRGEKAYAGKAVNERIEIAFDTPGGPFALPFHLVRPVGSAPPPVVLHLAFRPILRGLAEKAYPNLDDRYSPVEEILDRGFAAAIVCYQDIAPDTCDGDYSGHLAGLFRKPGPRGADEWGKIGLWAYGASRVMDYLQTRADLDRGCVSILGHSRLGKTALWCAAQDKRFFAALSNCSGFGGAALAKHGAGERVADFVRAGSWDWFCPAFAGRVGREDDLPYDQHFLVACLAPRFVNIASAATDRGADPRSEFLAGVAAGEAYRLLGLNGLVTPDRYPQPGDVLPEGEIGYQLRPGDHFLSRWDWARHLEFIEAKRRASRARPASG